MTKFHEDRAKIVDFLLMANFGTCAIFFLVSLYIVCFHTLSGLGCTDQNVNQEIGGYTIIWAPLYVPNEKFCVCFYILEHIWANFSKQKFYVSISINHLSITLSSSITNFTYIWSTGILDWKNDAYPPISWFTFWSVQPKVLKVWKQMIYHWKAL